MDQNLMHTPTPWTYESKGGKGSWIAGSNKEWSALSCGNTHETAEANAAFIVRAVNSHKALVAFVRDIARLSPHQFERSEDPCWVIDEARKLMGTLPQEGGER